MLIVCWRLGDVRLTGGHGEELGGVGLGGLERLYSIVGLERIERLDNLESLENLERVGIERLGIEKPTGKTTIERL